MRKDFTTCRNKPADYPYELIEGCKRGDYRSQFQVYKLYYKSVLSICMQFANDSVTAEEMMRESFIIAFENLNSYIGDINFSSWIKNFIKYTSKYGNKS